MPASGLANHQLVLLTGKPFPQKLTAVVWVHQLLVPSIFYVCIDSVYNTMCILLEVNLQLPLDDLPLHQVCFLSFSGELLCTAAISSRLVSLTSLRYAHLNLLQGCHPHKELAQDPFPSTIRFRWSEVSRGMRIS